MKMITVNDGLKGAGIGWILLVLFFFLFLSLLFDLVREKKLLNERRRARRMIEEGNAKIRRDRIPEPIKAKEKEKEKRSLERSEARKQKKEEETWKEQAKKRARDDIRFFR